MRVINRHPTPISQMRVVLGALFALVIADGVITSFLLQHGLGREGNPFLETLVGEPDFLTTKVAGAFLSALLLWNVYKRRPRAAMAVSLGIVVAYTAIVYWNILTFFTVSV